MGLRLGYEPFKDTRFMNLGFLTPFDLVIDVGTTHTVLASLRQNFMLRHQTRVALSFLATGKNGKSVARTMAHGEAAGLLPLQENMRVFDPMAHGRVSHAVALDHLLKAMAREAQGKRFMAWPPRGLGGLLVPPGYPAEDRLQLLELTQTLARGTVNLIDIPQAAAVGCNLSVNSPEGRMVMDLGGGRMTMGIFSMGEVVCSHVKEYGGRDLDQAIVNYVARRHDCQISLDTAQMVKHQLGSVYPLPHPAKLTISGTLLKGGKPRQIVLHDHEIRDVLLDAFEPLLLAIQQGFVAAPPELCGDVFRHGVTMVGGGSLLTGLPEMLRERLGLAFHRVEDPLNVKIRGAQALLLSGQSRQTA